MTGFFNLVVGSGHLARPITAMITKIDPSKPLGMIKLNVISKRTGKTFNTNFTMGSGSTTNETLRARLDPKLVSVM